MCAEALQGPHSEQRKDSAQWLLVIKTSGSCGSDRRRQSALPANIQCLVTGPPPACPVLLILSTLLPANPQRSPVCGAATLSEASPSLMCHHAVLTLGVRWAIQALEPGFQGTQCAGRVCTDSRGARADVCGAERVVGPTHRR